MDGNDLKTTIDSGESEVQIATIGEVVGSASDGSPVRQSITEESLERLVEKHKNDEILVDADHQSETGGKTEAKGWLSGLFVKPGVGLFGKIRWTDIGRNLVENRVFRWLSPSWYLDRDTREPIEMTSVALTNRPSQSGRIEPIVNSSPVEFNNEHEVYDMTIEREELEALVEKMVSAKVAESLAALEAVKDEAAVNECTEETEQKEEVPAAEEHAENSEQTDDGGNSETAEVKEETPVGDSDDEQAVEKEVIRLEALNSTPKTEGIDIAVNSISTMKTPYDSGYHSIVTIIR